MESKFIITGKKLVLRPYKLSDFKLCRTSHDKRLPPLDRFDTPISLCAEADYQKFKSRIKRYQDRARKKEHYVFGLFEKTGHAHVGHIDILAINQEIRWGNLGYHIQNHSYRKGYASEGCKLALEAAFEHLNFHRIEASMEIKNKASRKVALALNMDFEGKRRKFFPADGGVDMWVYATNAIDYPVMKYFL